MARDRAGHRVAAPHDKRPLEDWLPDALCASRHVDPYVVWVLHTDFRPFMRMGRAPRTLDFLVELAAPYDPGRGCWPKCLAGPASTVPAAYADPVPGSSERARHVTVRLRLGKRAATKAAIAALLLHEGVLRAQIGVPLPDLHDEDDEVVLPPVPTSGDRHTHQPPRLVLGVIEDACPFGHVALRSADGHTRVAALWDQTAAREQGADQPPPAWGYGRQRTGAQLQALLERHQHDGHVDEEALYGDRAALQPRLNGHHSHAAAVAILFAGDRNSQPAIPCQVAPRLDDPPVSLATPGGPGSQAPLVVVQLPREQIDTPGSRWFTVRALDGLRYIMASASGLCVPAGQGGTNRENNAGKGPSPAPPLVVNLSYGSVTGAHDGTALLETAMDELVALYGSMRIVLAAGNAAGSIRRDDGPQALGRGASGYHAIKDRLRPGSNARLDLFIPPGKTTETYLELWFEDPALAGDAEREHFLGERDIEVSVDTPTGGRLVIDRLPGMDFDDDVCRCICSGLIGLPRVAQSKKRSMVLLVVAATDIEGRMREPAAAGLWCVTVHNRGTRTLRADAWVERDQVPRSHHVGQVARLLPVEQRGAFELNDDNTLNNVATGQRVQRVGAVMALGDPLDPPVSAYSSIPGRGARGVEFSAIADESPASPGIPISGNLSGSVCRMNGTSVASPQAARWMADQGLGGAAGPGLPSAGKTARHPRRGRVILSGDPNVYTGAPPTLGARRR